MHCWASKVAPSILRTQALDYVRTTYGRELAIGKLELNPFLLRLVVHDIAFPDTDRRTLLGARQVVVDFEVSSLWRRAYTFKEVTLDGPTLLVVRRLDGRINLADLAPKSTTPAEPSSGAPPRIRLEFFNLRDGALEYDDLARAQPLIRKLAPLALALKDFETTAEGGAFNLAAQSPQGEQFQWRGRLSMAPNIAWSSELSVAGLRATGVAEVLGDALPFALTNGKIDFNGKVRGELGDTLTLQLDLDDVALNDMALRARDAQEDWVTIPATQLTTVRVAIPERRVSIARIKVDGARVQAWIDTDGSVNLARLFATGNSSAESTEATPTHPASPAWQVDIARVETNVAALEFEDRARTRGTKVVIAPLDVSVDDASLDLSKPLPIQLSAKINEQATLTVAGSVTPQPLAATLDVAVDKLPIALLQPYALAQAALTIEQGVAATNGKLQIKETDADELQIKFAGDASLANFESIDDELRQDFINFTRIDLESLDLSLSPNALSIARINVKNPYARVIISPEQILNVSAVLDPEGTERLRSERAEQAAAAKPNAGPKRAGPKRRKDAPPKAEERQIIITAKADGPPDAMSIKIREVRIDGGRMNFSDLNIQPNFNAEIRALRGTLSRLSTARSSRANVQLTGNVGEFSPVSISGAVQPFAFETFTDMTLRFENISLPIFNPYSGRFAGYNIAKGALTTELHYNIGEAARCRTSHSHRSTRMGRGQRRARRSDAAREVRDRAVARSRWRHQSRHARQGHARRSDLPRRSDRVASDQERHHESRHRTFRLARLAIQRIGRCAIRRLRTWARRRSSRATQEKMQTLSKALSEKPGLALDVPIGGQPDLDTAALIDVRYQDRAGQLGVD